MSDAPQIETARLILRPHRLEDFDSLLVMWSDAEVVRHIGGEPSTPEQVWSRLLRYAGHWALNGYGFWAVLDRAEGRHVGDVGLFEGRRGIDPSFADVPEAGWALHPSVHGRGYAAEAVTALLAWGAETKGFGRTVCMIEDGNHASISLAERLGYVEYKRTEYAGEPTRLFERL